MAQLTATGPAANTASQVNQQWRSDVGVSLHGVQAKREISPEPAEPVMRQRSGRPVAGEKLPFTAVHIFSRHDANNETLVTPLICV